MSLGAALDVVIGLSFTYLLLGVLASGAQELVATWLSKRAKDLRKGIGRLLADSNGKPVTDLFNKVVGHGLIEDLSPKKLPSYVPARNFSLALLEALKDGSQAPLFSQVENTIAKLPPGTARESLTALVTHAAGDLDALRSGIEIWFDDAMDRLSGAYKRFSQYFTLSFGIAVAIAFNVDSITLAKTLWTDPAARQAAGAAAQRYIDTPSRRDGRRHSGADAGRQRRNGGAPGRLGQRCHVGDGLDTHHSPAAIRHLENCRLDHHWTRRLSRRALLVRYPQRPARPAQHRS